MTTLQIQLDDNPIFPGNAGVVLPIGTTGQRGIDMGMVRLNSTLNLFEGTKDGSNWETFNMTNATVSSIDISTSSLGVIIGGSPITSSGTITVDLNPQLEVLASLNSPGFMVQLGTAAFIGRALTGTVNQIVVANGSGGGGNPVFSIDPDPILPGNAGVTLPSGVTPLRGGGAGTLRFNTTINLFEGTADGSTWDQFLTNSSSLSLIGDVSGSGALGSPITTTLNQTIQRSSGMEWQFTGNNSFTSHLLTLTNPVATYVSQWFLQKAVTPWTGYIHRYTRTPVGSGNFALTRWNNGVEFSQISFSEIDDYATIYNGLHMNLAPIDNVGTLSIGRTKGTVGASRIENYGQVGSVLGPHYQTVTSQDNYPNFQHLAWAHDNISLNFDSYYDGTSFKSSHIPSNFQIYKIGNRLNFNYALGFNLGSNITFATALSIGADGNIGIQTTTANADLQFSNTLANRKIVLYEVANNDHQFYGQGINGSTYRFQIDNVNSSFVFYAALSSSSSQELFRIKGNGKVGIGTSSPNGDLQFASNNNNRKIVLWEGTNNDHQYQGFGTNASALRFQVPDTTNDFIFYAATSSTTSQEVWRVKGNGDAVLPIGNLYAKSPYGAMYFESNSMTTTPSSGIWTKLLGTTTAGLLNQFTMPTDNRLQYTGIAPISVKIYADLSTIIGTSISRTCGISLYKNGSRIIPSIAYRYTDSLNLQYLLTTAAIINLLPNDYIELFLYVNTSSTFTPSQMKVIVTTI